jgi:hypothetical protein
MLDTEEAVVLTAPGVIARAPALMPLDIHALVEAELAKEPHTTNGVSLTVTLDGLDFVAAHRTANGWEIDGYLRIKAQPGHEVTAGITVLKRW